jgi:hypothetical protein
MAFISNFIKIRQLGQNGLILNTASLKVCIRQLLMKEFEYSAAVH